MGVETVKVLSEIPVELMQNLLGKNGTELWRRANGIDESPVVPYHEQQSISTETTFQEDTTDMQFLNSELVRMTEKIAFQLRQQNRLTGCVVVKLKYSDHEPHSIQRSIPYTNADDVLFRLAKELFALLYQRRVLIRMLGIRFTNLIPGTYQINLFDDTEEMISLYQAIDSVKKRFGEKFVLRAGGVRTDRVLKSI